jgi:putative ABC transport system substrate-binding protein
LVTWARAGALLAYAPDLVAIWSQSAHYVSEILRGSDPATLPIEQATATQLAINKETARTLDIAIPPPILARADEVIEASG